MITSIGVHLYRWYRQGITDPEDLLWLVRFYFNQSGWNQNLILAELQEARRYYAAQTPICSLMFSQD